MENRNLSFRKAGSKKQGGPGSKTTRGPFNSSVGDSIPMSQCNREAAKAVKVGSIELQSPRVSRASVEIHARMQVGPHNRKKSK